MTIELPFAPACERNRQPILEALLRVFPGEGRALEIGSCTGQHIVYFAPRFPALAWQPSDRAENLPGLEARISAEGSPNILDAIELDVTKPWPPGRFGAVYSSNTAHIMGWDAVCAMFKGVGECLLPGGVFCLYGPFNENGRFTSESNREFDADLRSRNPEMGLRDIEALDSLAQSHHMSLSEKIRLPANNQLLVFQTLED